MEILNGVLSIILYFLLCILVVVLIVFVIRGLSTLKKVDKTIEDVNSKMNKLDGVFNLVDRGADALSLATDKLVMSITSGITSLFKKKKKEEDEENE